MSQYTVTLPEGEERGVKIACDEHGESEEFQPGYRTVAFHCEGCGYELELTVHDLLNPREQELC